MQVLSFTQSIFHLLYFPFFFSIFFSSPFFSSIFFSSPFFSSTFLSSPFFSSTFLSSPFFCSFSFSSLFFFFLLFSFLLFSTLFFPYLFSSLPVSLIVSSLYTLCCRNLTGFEMNNAVGSVVMIFLCVCIS